MRIKYYNAIIKAHASHCPQESYSVLCRKLRKSAVVIQDKMSVMTRLPDGRIKVLYHAEMTEHSNSQYVIKHPIKAVNDLAEQIWNRWFYAKRIQYWHKHIDRYCPNESHLLKRDKRWWRLRFALDTKRHSKPIFEKIWQRHYEEIIICQQ
jgi:ABC-type dipeptide/oligopeptide/nickel transport system ATPase component